MKRRSKRGKIGFVNNSLKHTNKRSVNISRKRALQKSKGSRLKKTTNMGHKEGNHSWCEKSEIGRVIACIMKHTKARPTYIGHHLGYVMGQGLNEI